MLQAQDVITLETGSYRLEAPLAQSSYGLVWQAHGPHGCSVALKFINQAQMAQAPLALQGRWVDSARKETAFLASLAPWDERHIVRLLDHGQHHGLPVLAMELLGADLAQARPADTAQLLDWMVQVNQALAKVHQYGWLYLDLKPSNVLTTPHGGVKLADFGTSRLRSHGASVHYSGTASWQAPEQLQPQADGSYALNEATDYFALGALFYYVATGAQLRFCRDCGDAWRQKQPMQMAQILRPDEEQRFVAAIDGGDATWCPAGGSAAGALALSLLRSLLAADARRRPRHALEISRMLTAVRSAPQMRSAA